MLPKPAKGSRNLALPNLSLHLGVTRVYRGHGYTTVVLRRTALLYIEWLEWRQIDPATIPRPRPLLDMQRVPQEPRE